MFMGTPEGSLRARKKAATEAALQESALSLFAQKGYDATTIEEIVADADVSRRTFFRYFGSKEEVIFKGTSNDFDTFRRLLREQPEGKDIEALKQAVVEFVLYLQKRKAPVLEFIEVVVASPTLRARAAELEGRWTAAAAEGLAERNGIDVNMRCRLLGALATAVLVEGIQNWKSGRESDPETAVRTAFKAVEDKSLLD